MTMEIETNTGKNYYTELYRTAMIISSSIELNQVLENIVEGVTKAMGARATTLHLRDRESGQLMLEATYGLSDGYLQRRSLDPLSVGRDGQDCSSIGILNRNEGVPLQYQDRGAREELVLALCTPLRAYDESIGVIQVYTDEPVTFQEEDKKFLSILSGLAAQAIENARLYDVAISSYNGMVNAFLGV
jgi:GAF domain-containing protein